MAELSDVRGSIQSYPTRATNREMIEAYRKKNPTLLNPMQSKAREFLSRHLPPQEPAPGLLSTSSSETTKKK